MVTISVGLLAAFVMVVHTVPVLSSALRPGEVVVSTSSRPDLHTAASSARALAPSLLGPSALAPSVRAHARPMLHGVPVWQGWNSTNELQSRNPSSNPPLDHNHLRIRALGGSDRTQSSSEHGRGANSPPAVFGGAVRAATESRYPESLGWPESIVESLYPETRYPESFVLEAPETHLPPPSAPYGLPPHLPPPHLLSSTLVPRESAPGLRGVVRGTQGSVQEQRTRSVQQTPGSVPQTGVGTTVMIDGRPVFVMRVAEDPDPPVPPLVESGGTGGSGSSAGAVASSSPRPHQLFAAQRQHSGADVGTPAASEVPRRRLPTFVFEPVRRAGNAGAASSGAAARTSRSAGPPGASSEDPNAGARSYEDGWRGREVAGGATHFSSGRSGRSWAGVAGVAGVLMSANGPEWQELFHYDRSGRSLGHAHGHQPQHDEVPEPLDRTMPRPIPFGEAGTRGAIDIPARPAASGGGVVQVFVLSEKGGLACCHGEKAPAKLDWPDHVPVPEEFVCPLTRERFVDPVIDNLGQTYERCAVEEFIMKELSKRRSRN